jgi:putative membrane protein
MGAFRRILIGAGALWVATRVVSGVSYEGGWLPFLGVALVFGVVNACVRPVARILALPLVIVTLGLFLFVINGLMLWLTGAVSESLGLGFRVNGFFPAFWGGLVVSVVSTLLSLVFRTDEGVTYQTIQ